MNSNHPKPIKGKRSLEKEKKKENRATELGLRLPTMVIHKLRL